MADQKFHKGDWVRVADDLGPSMSHFPSSIDAVVIGSYADQYGGGDSGRDHYSLHLKGRGHSSWYYDNHLTLIERNRPDVLAEWEAAEEVERKRVSDLTWIFAQPFKDIEDVLTKALPGPSVVALAACLGFTVDDLWGSRGEGLTYYERSLRVLAMAAPFLVAHDEAGWLGACAEFKAK